MPGYWVSDSYTSNPIWNVTALEKRGIKNFNPTSWLDFADPKLVPLTCFSNLATSASGIPWGIAMRKTVGEEWLVKLGKGKPALYQKAEQGETWIGSGEYPIGLTATDQKRPGPRRERNEGRMGFPKRGAGTLSVCIKHFCQCSPSEYCQAFCRLRQECARSQQDGRGQDRSHLLSPGC